MTLKCVFLCICMHTIHFSVFCRSMFILSVFLRTKFCINTKYWIYVNQYRKIIKSSTSLMKGENFKIAMEIIKELGRKNKLLIPRGLSLLGTWECVGHSVALRLSLPRSSGVSQNQHMWNAMFVVPINLSEAVILESKWIKYNLIISPPDSMR